jgi:hypothetical protein
MTIDLEQPVMKIRAKLRLSRVEPLGVVRVEREDY